MAQTVKKFDINTNGHDYFCTDIHGCKTKLFKLLNAIQFDFENDRLFCAGDIVDRGPESLECAMLVKEKWFHSVQGNHEDMHGISNKITIFREDNELIYSIDKYDRVQYVELEHYHKN